MPHPSQARKQVDHAVHQQPKLEDIDSWIKRVYPQGYKTLVDAKAIQFSQDSQEEFCFLFPNKKFNALESFYLQCLEEKESSIENAHFWVSIFLERVRTPWYKNNAKGFIETRNLSVNEMRVIKAFFVMLDDYEKKLENHGLVDEKQLLAISNTSNDTKEKNMIRLLLSRREFIKKYGGSKRLQLQWLTELLRDAYSIDTDSPMSIAGQRPMFETNKDKTSPQVVAVQISRDIFEKTFQDIGMSKDEARVARIELSMKF